MIKLVLEYRQNEFKEAQKILKALLKKRINGVSIELKLILLEDNNGDLSTEKIISMIDKVIYENNKDYKSIVSKIRP